MSIESYYSCVFRQQPLLQSSLCMTEHTGGFLIYISAVPLAVLGSTLLCFIKEKSAPLWLWQLRRPSAAALPFARLGAERADWALTADSWRERGRERERWQERNLAVSLRAFLNKLRLTVWALKGRFSQWWWLASHLFHLTVCYCISSLTNFNSDWDVSHIHDMQ